MSEPTRDEQAGQIDRALLEAQRQERADQESDLERQRRADDVIVDALASRTPPTDPPVG